MGIVATPVSVDHERIGDRLTGDRLHVDRVHS
jgi:hypothetical protein